MPVSWSFLLKVCARLCKSACPYVKWENQLGHACSRSPWENLHPHLKGTETHQLSFTQSHQMPPRILSRGENHCERQKEWLRERERKGINHEKTSVWLLKKCSGRKSPWQRQETTCFHHGNRAWVGMLMSGSLFSEGREKDNIQYGISWFRSFTAFNMI